MYELVFIAVLWNVYGECENIAVMTGHTGAVMDLHFSTDGGVLFTCSTDSTVALWDLQTCQRIKKLKGNAIFYLETVKQITVIKAV